jgi:hypothetical protein
MEEINTSTKPKQPEKTASEAELAGEAAAAVMQALPYGSRMYYQGFLNGLQVAAEVDKAG